MQHVSNVLYFLVVIISFLPSLILSHGFVADTIVKTVDRYEVIENILIGSPVASYNSKTDANCSGIVTSKTYATSTTYILIRFGTLLLTTHPEQRFWLISKNFWVKASDLISGDRLLTLTGAIMVDEIGQYSTDDPLTFFTLTVANQHTFCVTEHDIVVHNFGPEIGIPVSAMLLTGISGATASVALPIIPLATGIICAGIFVYKFFQEQKEHQQCKIEYQLRLQEATQQEDQKQWIEDTNIPIVFLTQQPQKEVPKHKDSKNQLPSEPKEPKKNDDDTTSVGTAAIALLQAVEESKEKATEIFKKTCDYLATEGGLARIAHAFRKDCGHNFGPLFAKMGADINNITADGKKKIVEVGTQIILDISKKLIEMGTKLNVNDQGLFRDIVVEYGGELITVRGCIHDGVIKTGTLFIQPQHVK